MKLPPLMVWAVCLAFLACDQDQVAPSDQFTGSDNPEITSPEKSNPNGRSFSARISYDGYTMGGSGSCTVLSRSSDAYSAQLDLEGRASQMGRVTGVIQCCKQMPNYIGSTDVTGILTTSNGQELWFKCDWLGHYYDDEELDMAIYRGEATIVGGKGRFENATGSFQMLVSQALSQPEGIYLGEAEFDGTIAY